MSERKKTDYKRPSYTPEFKAGAVRLIVEEGRAVSQVATELGVSQTALREWLIDSKSTPGRDLESGALTASERAELVRLRRENRILTEEREILKKRRPSSRERVAEVRLCRRGEGHLADSNDLSSASGLCVGLLRLAESSRV